MRGTNGEFTVMGEQTEMGRFSVEFSVANNRDVVCLGHGVRIPEGVKHLVLSGVVDSGAARLVLPQRVVDELQLQDDGETMVRTPTTGERNAGW